MARTTIVLAIVATAMLAFIVFYERDTIGSRELEERKGRVLSRFVRSRVDKLEIERKGATLVLSRKPDPDIEYELGEWGIEKPFSARADEEVVDGLLGELEWLEPERTLSDIAADDRKRFGFDKPRLRLRYAMGKQTVSLIVGKEDPTGHGVYVAADDPSKAFVVSNDLVEALDHGPGHFHTKEMHEGISTYRVRSLRLRDADGERVVEKREGLYWLSEPIQALAATSAVEETLDALDGMRAKRFVTHKLKDPSQYGLDAPVLEAVVEEPPETETAQPDKKGVHEGKGKKEATKEEPVRLRFRAGAPCREGDAEKELYAVVGETGPVMCVAEEALSKVRKTAEGLRDRRFLPFKDGKIKVLHLASGPKRLELREKDYSWHYKAYVDKREVASGEADQEAVDEWFKALRATEAKAFAPADQPSLRAARVEAPRTTLTLETRGSEQRFVIRVGSVKADAVFVRRDREPWVMSFPASCQDLLEPTSVRFRKLQLLTEPQKDLVRLEIQRRGTRDTPTLETLVKGEDDKWSLEKPLDALADDVTVTELARQLSQLKADRYVADLAEPRHGLGNPYMTISAQYKPSSGTADGLHEHPEDDQPEDDKGEASDKGAASDVSSKSRTHAVKLGNEAEGGRYAQLGENPVVFVAPSELVDQVADPLVSRDLLSTATTDIETIELRSGDETLSIRRKGEGFEVVGSDGDDGRSEEAGQLATRISNLRASAVISYGKPAAAYGLQAPSHRIAVTHRFGVKGPSGVQEPQTHELLFGRDATLPGQTEQTEPHGEPHVYVRRSDLPVTFAVTASTKEQLFELLP